MPACCLETGFVLYSESNQHGIVKLHVPEFFKIVLLIFDGFIFSCCRRRRNSVNKTAAQLINFADALFGSFGSYKKDKIQSILLNDGAILGFKFIDRQVRKD